MQELYGKDRLSERSPPVAECRFTGSRDGSPYAILEQPSFYNHPFVLAMRAASTRFPAPNLLIASER